MTGRHFEQRLSKKFRPLTVFQLMNEFHHLPVFNVDFHCNICRVLDQIDLCQAMFAYYGASRLKSEAGNFCGP